MESSDHPLFAFYTAKRIIAGAHSLDSINEHLSEIGKFRSALIFTQPSIMNMGAIDKIIRSLLKMGVSSQVNIDIKHEPTVQNLENVHRSITEDFDIYIGIGGGSVLDATKILSVLKTNTMSIRQMIGTDLVQNAGLPVVLIPTTSGTGSEVTPNAIVTLPEDELKVGIVSRHLLPELVILDPMLTLGLPSAITAATGMDAFTHALESYISNKANPISNMFALESIRLISRSILTAYHQGSSLAAREDMLIGSMYGGMALTSAGTAAVHALAYPLGGKFNIPHGVANSMLLPHVMEFNQDVIAQKLHSVAEAMHLPNARNLSEAQAAELVVSQIIEWTKELNIPQNLEFFGVKQEDVEQLAVSASKVTRLLNNNPKKMSTSEMELVYRKLLPRESDVKDKLLKKTTEAV